MMSGSSASLKIVMYLKENGQLKPFLDKSPLESPQNYLEYSLLFQIAF